MYVADSMCLSTIDSPDVVPVVGCSSCNASLGQVEMVNGHGRR